MSSQGNDGECQLEMNFVGEGDLEGRFNSSCKKNSGHKKFLSVKSLKLKDLPEDYQTPVILDFIHYMAKFTVRLVVNFKGPASTCICRNARPCTCVRGNVRNTGSGLVTGLAGPDQLTPDVRDSTKTYFILVTAAHVIFDTSEAQKTEIEFFYDDPHDRSSVRKAFGLRVLNTNVEADFSEVLCVTEDHLISKVLNNCKFYRKESDEILTESSSPNLFPSYSLQEHFYYNALFYAEDPVISETLFNRIDRFKKRYNIATKRSSPTLSQGSIFKHLSFKRNLQNVEKSTLKRHETVSRDLVFHISHPHGTSKKVTLGNIVNADTRNGHYKLIYSLATCSGSSGGPVCVIPENVFAEKYTFRNVDSIFSVPHSRHYGNDLNSSSSWTVYFSDPIDLAGKPKSSVEVTTLSTQSIVPLLLLDIEDLPSGYRYYHNLHLIKNISKFTVGINVLNDATFDSKNMASGFVTRLAKNDDMKPDLKGTTKTYFIMVTAARVISDTSQAKKTEINFFCDDLQDMSSVRKAFGLRVLNSDKETNVSEVLCFTTDQVISSMLKEHFLELSKSNPQSDVSEFISALSGCLTGSLVLIDFIIWKIEGRTHYFSQVYMNLKTDFERLVLIILFVKPKIASHILVREYEETHHSEGYVTFESDVFNYLTFLHYCLRDKLDGTDPRDSIYANQNEKKLLDFIRHTSTELYCELMNRSKITFQILHHGKKEISFDIPYLADHMGEINICYMHDSPVFTIFGDVSYRYVTVDLNVLCITCQLHQSDLDQSFECPNDKVLSHQGTIYFPGCNTRRGHGIRFWETQLYRKISDIIWDCIKQTCNNVLWGKGSKRYF